jgi:hypothetical protein
MSQVLHRNRPHLKGFQLVRLAVRLQLQVRYFPQLLPIQRALPIQQSLNHLPMEYQTV